MNNYGVPQGSVPRPLLFLLYINDLPNAVTEGIVKLFADDSNLFLSDCDLSRLEYKANLSLQQLQDWFTANGLTINPSKTTYTVFTRFKNRDINIRLILNP